MKFLLLTLLLAACSDERTPTEPSNNEPSKQVNVSGMSWCCDRNDPAYSGKVAPMGRKLSLVWRAQLKGGIYSSPVMSEGMLYVTDEEKLLYCLDLSRGHIHWARELEHAVFAPLLLHENTLYWGDTYGMVTAFDLKTQKPLWSFQKSEEKIMSGLGLSPDATQLIYGGYDFHLRVLSRSNGKELFSLKTANYINGTPAIVGERAYVGGCDHYIRALNISEKKEEFKVKLPSYIPSGIASDGERLYAACYDGSLQARSLDGQPLWIYECPKKSPSYQSSPAVNSQYVAVVEKNGLVSVLDKKTGKPQSSHTTLGDVEISPLIDEQRALICDNDGVLDLIDLKTGALIHRERYGTVVTAPLISQGGYLILCDEEGRVSCYQWEE